MPLFSFFLKIKVFFFSSNFFITQSEGSKPYFKWSEAICNAYAHYLSYQTSLPNQPTSLKVKDLHNFAIFQPICLKLGLETQNGKTPLMYRDHWHQPKTNWLSYCPWATALVASLLLPKSVFALFGQRPQKGRNPVEHSLVAGSEPWGWGLSPEFVIWASRLGFGSEGWNLSLEAEIWAWRLEFKPGGWDLSL